MKIGSPIKLHREFRCNRSQKNNTYKVVPPSYKLVYNPINYRYITNKNHSYWSYVHQLSYLGGTTLYKQSQSCRVSGALGCQARLSFA